MKTIINILLPILCALTFLQVSAQKKQRFVAKKLYASKQLEIHQISKNSFQHISFLQTNSFGNVPCNGLIVQSNNEAIVFDTPTNDSASFELIEWIKNTLNCKIVAVVPTHFHEDCLGGLNAFHLQKISSFSNQKTIELTKVDKTISPQIGFTDSTNLKVGKDVIVVKFFGEGHTIDNVVAYFKKDNVLFGGCLIKELNATKGYLGNANLNEWSTTVKKVKQAFPKVKIVVPGHGACGTVALLDYTIALFKVK